MSKKKKGTFEYRHYELPQDLPVLALLGEGWIRKYDLILHFHNHLEIGYCYSGTGDLYVEDNINRFSPGSFSFIPQNVPHATKSDEGTVSKWEYLFLDMEGLMKYFNDKWYINSIASPISSKAYQLDAKHFPVIANLILQIMDEMRYHRHCYQVSVRGLILALFIKIGRLDLEIENISDIHQQQKSIQIVNALEYISENYMDPIKINELAEMCHMSETHFRRLFHNIMSISPLEYINKARIHASCSLLRSTEDSILSIALKTGFSTVTTFNRNFNKVVGTTPLKWRNASVNVEKNLKNYNIKKLDGWL